MTIGDKCIRCGDEPRLPARLIGAECRRIQQRGIAREYARRKRNERVDSDVCCCGVPTCNGLRCDSLRHGSAA